MPVVFLNLSFRRELVVVQTLGVAMAVWATGCECAYGGVGCGAPYLIACESLHVNTDYRLAAAYSDDSAVYVLDVVSAESSEDAVDVEVVNGRALVRATTSTPFELEVRVDGWSESHRWAFTATDDATCDVPQDVSTGEPFFEDEFLRDPVGHD